MGWHLSQTGLAAGFVVPAGTLVGGGLGFVGGSIADRLRPVRA